MPRFFRGTVKGLKSDEDQETILTLRVPGTEYEKVSSVGTLVKQVLVIGIFTEEEFLAVSEDVVNWTYPPASERDHDESRDRISPYCP